MPYEEDEYTKIAREALAQTIPSIQQYQGSLDDMARDMNTAQMIQSGRRQTMQEQQQNISNLRTQLEQNQDLQNQARDAFTKMQTDYTNLTGRTDYQDAIQQNLKTATRDKYDELAEQILSQYNSPVPSLDSASSGGRRNRRTTQSNVEAAEDAQTRKDTMKLKKLQNRSQRRLERIEREQEQKKVDAEKYASDQLEKGADLVYKDAVKNGKVDDEMYGMLTDEQKQAVNAKLSEKTDTKKLKKYDGTVQAGKLGPSDLEAEAYNPKVASKRTVKLPQRAESIPGVDASLEESVQTGLRKSMEEPVQTGLSRFMEETEPERNILPGLPGNALAKPNNVLREYEDGGSGRSFPVDPIVGSGRSFPAEEPHQTFYDSVMNSDENKLERWSAPDYKMTADEEAEAKQMSEDYFKQNFRGVNQRFVGNVEDQENGTVDMMSALYNKTHKGAAFTGGLLGSLQGLGTMATDAISGLVRRFGGEDTADAIEALNEATNESIQGARTQHPLITGAGTMTGKVGQYSAINSALEAAGVTPALERYLTQGKDLGATGKALAGVLSRLGAGELADVALDTIPTEYTNARNGMSFQDILNDTYQNLGMNMAYNMFGEVMSEIPGLIGDLRNASPDEIIKAAGTLVDNGSIRNVADQSIEQIPSIAKATDGGDILKNANLGVDDTSILARQTGISVDDISSGAYDNSIGGADDAIRSQTADGTGNAGDLQQPGSARETDSGQLFSQRGESPDSLQRDQRPLVRAVDDGLRKQMDDAGISDFELQNVSNDYDSFSKNLEANRKSNEHGAFVDPKTPEELVERGAKAFSNSDGSATAAVLRDGDIVGVSKNSANPKKGAVDDLLITARANGGDRLDCYGAKLVDKYSRCGFEPVARVPYQYGINDEMDAYCTAMKAKYGDEFTEPDVYFMKLRDGESIEQTLDGIRNKNYKSYSPEELRALPEMEYDDAAKYRDELIDTYKKSQGSDGNTIPGLNATAEAESTLDALQKEAADITSTDGKTFFRKSTGEEVSMDELYDLNRRMEEAKRASDIPNIAQTTAEGSSSGEVPPVNDGLTRGQRMAQQAEAGNLVNTYGSPYEAKTMKTARTSGNWDQEALDEVSQDVVRQAPKTETQSINTAVHKIQDDPEGVMAAYTHKYENAKEIAGKFTSEDVDGMNIMANRLRKMIAETDDPELKAKYRAQQAAIAENLTLINRNAGQVAQANAKWARTADGALTQAEGIAQRQVKEALSKDKVLSEGVDSVTNEINSALKNQNLNSDNVGEVRKQVENTVRNAVKKNKSVSKAVGEDGIQELTDTIMRDKQYVDIKKALSEKATGFSSVKDETVKKVYDIFNQAQQLPYNSKERVMLERDAFAMLASDLGVGKSFGDKVNTWRYLAMLGNPRTHVRNLLGNLGFGAATDLSDTISAISQNILEKASGGKYQAERGLYNLLSKEGRQAFADNYKAAADFADSYAYREMSGNHWTSAAHEIRTSGKAFSDSHPLGRFLNWAAEKNGGALDIEDYWFLKKKFAFSMAQRMKKAGISGDELKNAFTSIESLQPSQAKLVQDMMDAAIEDAKYATFHTDEGWGAALARGISNASNGAKIFGESADNILSRIAGKAAHVGIEASVPFKKTPANIMKAGVDFSPVGLIGGGIDLGKALRKNPKDAAKALDELSRGLTGTGLMVLGGYLYDKGRLTTAASDDTRRSYYEEMTGKQQYALNLQDLSGKAYTYTIDWLGPAALPLLVGAQTYAAMEENGGISASEFVDAISQITNPVLETTMLQGMGSLIDAMSSKNKGNRGNIVINALQEIPVNYATQLIPSIFGATARTIDPLRRSNYTGKKGSANVIAKTIQKTKNKLPGLSMLSQPYVNQRGEEEYNTGGESMVGRAFQNFVSPGYLQPVDETEVDKRILSLADVTGSSSVIPKTAVNSYEIDGVKHQMTPEEYHDYATNAGQTQMQIIASLFDTDYFNSMDSEDQKKHVEDVLSVSQAIALNEQFDKPVSKGNKLATIYENHGGGAEGTEALVRLMEAQDDVKSYSDSGNITTRGIVHGLSDYDATDQQEMTEILYTNPSEGAISAGEKFDNGRYMYYAIKDAAIATEEGATAISQERLRNLLDDDEATAAINDGVPFTQQEKADWWDHFYPNAKKGNPYGEPAQNSEGTAKKETTKEETTNKQTVHYQKPDRSKLSQNQTWDAYGFEKEERYPDAQYERFQHVPGLGDYSKAAFYNNYYAPIDVNNNHALSKSEVTNWVEKNYKDDEDRRYWFNVMGYGNWKNPY